jgi:adhesin transport system outer membrane protein
MTASRGNSVFRVGMRALVAVPLWWCVPSLAQSLPSLIEGVLSSHPSVRSQLAQGESAKQAVEGAQWQFYPTPSIGFEQVDANPADPSYPSYGDKNVTTLRLQQPLWTGGRLSAGLDRAEAGVLASQATLEGTRQDLAVRVVQIYADWYGALLKRQALDKSLQAHKTLREQILRRIGNGVSPQSDLTLLVGRQQQTEADLSASRAQEQTALGRLSQMLGRTLQPQALAESLSVALVLDENPQDLMDQAQTLSPSVVRLQAQARIADAEISERKADLSPEVYVRAERQYGNYAVPNSSPINRYFVGFSSRLGAGLSSLSQVGGAQARYEAALADIDSTRISLGEQIQADFAQAEAGQARLAALQASLSSSDNIARAWSRQFVAGRKTWLDVMNAVREQAQLETQIADARASQLLLSWRLAIVGRGVDSALVLGQNNTAAKPAAMAPVAAPVSDLAQALAATEVPAIADAFGDEGWQATGQVPLYAQDPDQGLDLRMAAQIDLSHLGLGLGLLSGTQTGAEPGTGTGANPADAPAAPHYNNFKEAAW